MQRNNSCKHLKRKAKRTRCVLEFLAGGIWASFMILPLVLPVPEANALESVPAAPLMTCAVEAEKEMETVLYDVPLDDELQFFIIQECEEHHIEPEIILAMIERESAFTPDIVGDNGNSFGLMQIQPKWHYQRMADLDCTDLLDPQQNVTVGIDLLSELVDRYEGDIAKALTAYNQGSFKGTVSEYAKTVIEKAGEMDVLHG